MTSRRGDCSTLRKALGALVLGVLAVASVLAPLVAPYDPSLASGAPLLKPGADHLLGTNDIGQDVWSQLLWGSRASLSIAAVVTLISSSLSWTVGLTAGLSKKAAPALMALTDLLLALPAVPLYLLVVALLGPSQLHLMLALGVLSWPAFARIVRSRVIEVRGASYVEAARALGAGPVRIGLCHVAPATLELLPAKLVLTVRFAIFAEATLAFLGLGDPSSRSWGSMLGTAFGDPLTFVGGSWTWRVIPPTMAIVIAVLCTTWLSVDTEPR